MTKLMYVYDQTGETDRECFEQATTVVEEISAEGIIVQAVSNRRYRSEDQLFELEVEASESDVVWVDVPTIDIGRNTRHIIGAAEEAGVLVLGQLDINTALRKILDANIGDK